MKQEFGNEIHLQGVERVRFQEQGLQLPSIQPAASKPNQQAQPASQPSQPASQLGGKVS